LKKPEKLNGFTELTIPLRLMTDPFKLITPNPLPTVITLLFQLVPISKVGVA
jgi:hypothetical protein